VENDNCESGLSFSSHIVKKSNKKFNFYPKEKNIILYDKKNWKWKICLCGKEKLFLNERNK
jgi:hypothetical protein